MYTVIVDTRLRAHPSTFLVNPPTYHLTYIPTLASNVGLETEDLGSAALDRFSQGVEVLPSRFLVFFGFRQSSRRRGTQWILHHVSFTFHYFHFPSLPIGLGDCGELGFCSPITFDQWHHPNRRFQNAPARTKERSRIPCRAVYACDDDAASRGSQFGFAHYCRQFCTRDEESG